MSQNDVEKDFEKPAPKHFARRASTYEEEEPVPVAIDENVSAGRIISGETDDIAMKYSEAKKQERHYEKGEKAKEIALKHLERRASAHGADETLPVEFDENTPTGRVISGETDDMLMKYKEMMQQAIMSQ